MNSSAGLVRRRTSQPKAAMPARPPSSQSRLNPWAKTVAMMMIPPKSSATASVSRNARNDVGRRRPNAEMTATANAMSVAVGTAQPPGSPLATVLTRR